MYFKQHSIFRNTFCSLDITFVTKLSFINSSNKSYQVIVHFWLIHIWSNLESILMVRVHNFIDWINKYIRFLYAHLINSYYVIGYNIDSFILKISNRIHNIIIVVLFLFENVLVNSYLKYFLLSISIIFFSTSLLPLLFLSLLYFYVYLGKLR